MCTKKMTVERALRLFVLGDASDLRGIMGGHRKAVFVENDGPPYRCTVVEYQRESGWGESGKVEAHLSGTVHLPFEGEPFQVGAGVIQVGIDMCAVQRRLSAREFLGLWDEAKQLSRASLL